MTLHLPLTALAPQMAAQKAAPAATLSTALLTITLALSACAGAPPLTTWEADLIYTHRLNADGQHALAAKRYRTLRTRASRPEDADEAGLMACEATRRASAEEAAARCFDELARTAHSRPTRARALLHAAEIRFEHPSERPAALLSLWALVDRAPDTAAALRALTLLHRQGRETNQTRQRITARLLQSEARQPQSPLADNLLLRAAELLSEANTPNDDQRAIALLYRMDREHPDSPALLRGLWLRASLLSHQTNPDREAKTLEEIVRTLETSHIVATYIEPEHIGALEKLVALYSGPLRQPKRSEQCLHRLLTIAPDHLRVFAWMTRLAHIQEERGEKKQALKTWRALLRRAKSAQTTMKANDRRICREEPDASKRADCLSAIAAFSSPPIKELPAAREAVSRLQKTAEGR